MNLLSDENVLLSYNRSLCLSFFHIPCPSLYPNIDFTNDIDLGERSWWGLRHEGGGTLEGTICQKRNIYQQILIRGFKGTAHSKNDNRY